MGEVGGCKWTDGNVSIPEVIEGTYLGIEMWAGNVED